MSKLAEEEFRNEIDELLASLNEAGKSTEINYLKSIVEKLVWMKTHLNVDKNERKSAMTALAWMVADDCSFSKTELGLQVVELMRMYEAGIR